jgi:hypothetical protein
MASPGPGAGALQPAPSSLFQELILCVYSLSGKKLPPGRRVKMAKGHLTEDLLRAVARGELPPRAIVQVGVSHLMGLCETCRREIESFWRKAKEDPAAQGMSLLPAVVGQQVSRLEEDLRRATSDLRELLDLPAEERLGRIRRARGRFRSPLLVRMLRDESHKLLPDEAEEALQLAELARTVTQHIPYLPGSFDLLALANAEKANARFSTGLPRPKRPSVMYACWSRAMR